MNYISAGEVLKNLRLEKGLTQTQVARAINTTPSLISMYESNRRLLSRNALVKLAELYEVSLDKIMYSPEEQETNLNEKDESAYKAIPRIPMYDNIEQLCCDDPADFATSDNLLFDLSKGNYFYVKYIKAGVEYWALIEDSKKIRPNSTYLVKSGRKLNLVKTEDLTDRNRLNVLGVVKSLIFLF